MHRAALAPRVHLFVCANRRAPDAPLGPGCGDAGDEVYARLKDEVARRGAFREVWVTRTYCLGVCPKRGATVAAYGRRGDASSALEQAIWSEVEPGDAAALFAQAVDA
jgi:hypothetical protein